ncbi:MAG: DNA recombination protein RmuC, partial [Deltaproteobacteria bacterium]|nr:DNA recombination protein RmuC [Deltaproteobacteria bacterium]
KNVRISETGGDVVEFAIKLPGQSDLPEDCVLIPVDAKFPIEDYQRLLEAQELGDVAAADESVRQLETGIKKAARDIFQKYIAPPKTTDFGIMFLPSEGLYAEVIRRTALVGVLQREYHIVVTGPTTFAALLNSLQMGFRTLAIQKRSGEVWKVLGEVKTAFGRFGDTLDNVRKKLEQAANSVDDAQKKTKTLSNKLKAVEASTDTRPTDDGITDDMPSHRASEHE